MHTPYAVRGGLLELQNALQKFSTHQAVTHHLPGMLLNQLDDITALTATLPNLPEIAHTAHNAVIGINDKPDGSADVYVYFNNGVGPYVYPHDPYFGNVMWTVGRLTEELLKIDRPSELTILYSSTVDFRPNKATAPLNITYDRDVTSLNALEQAIARLPGVLTVTELDGDATIESHTN